MLASHLHRLSRVWPVLRPVRYAIDRGDLPAVRNFLHLAVQAHAVPQAHRRATDTGADYYTHEAARAGPRMPALAEHPRERRMFHDLVATHDPAALFAYLDSLNERGVQAGDTPFDPGQLPFHRVAPPADRLLHPLLHLAGQLQDPAELAAIRAGFHPDALSEHRGVIRNMLHSGRPAYDDSYYTGTPWQYLNAILNSHPTAPAERPLADALPNAIERVGMGDTPTALADLAKLIHQIRGFGVHAPGVELFRADETAHGLLHQRVLPYFMNLGHQLAGHWPGIPGG